jgi:hypothetical protein
MERKKIISLDWFEKKNIKLKKKKIWKLKAWAM